MPLYTRKYGNILPSYPRYQYYDTVRRMLSDKVGELWLTGGMGTVTLMWRTGSELHIICDGDLVCSSEGPHIDMDG